MCVGRPNKSTQRNDINVNVVLYLFTIMNIVKCLLQSTHYVATSVSVVFDDLFKKCVQTSVESPGLDQTDDQNQDVNYKLWKENWFMNFIHGICKSHCRPTIITNTKVITILI